METTKTALIDRLAAVREAVCRCEKEAAQALAAGDRATHRRKLEEKTARLVDLPAVVGELVAGLPVEDGERLLAELEEIAQDAGQAARIGSVFYMSALLYPADHKAGDDTELDAILRWLRQI